VGAGKVRVSKETIVSFDRKNPKKPEVSWQRIPKGTESLLAHDFAGKV